MSRRGENIHKRKDGRWEARYIKARINDKTIYKSIYARSYREVKAKLKEQIKQDIHLPDKIKQDKKIKFDEVFNQYINKTLSKNPLTTNISIYMKTILVLF